MLTILNKGIHVNLDLDPDELTGDIETDLKSAYIQSLVSGKIVGIDSDGFLQLADGDPANDVKPVGFLVRDAAGYFMENKPALSSGKMAVTLGNCNVISDQINIALTFAPGEEIFCGTGAEVGNLTNVSPGSGAKVMGISNSPASNTAPELNVLV